MRLQIINVFIAIICNSCVSAEIINLPFTYENCFLSEGEFCVAYSTKFEELIKLCQKNGMFPESRHCLKCNERW